MAFSDYKNIAQVQEQFNIKYREEQFIVAPRLEPPAHFLTEFAFYKENVDVSISEAARCEIIISPILREIYKRYYDRYSFWIQKAIKYNEVLAGTPDYMFATKSALGKTVLGIPILVIVEAKKSDFEQGWGQCLAELVAAQQMNGEVAQAVYGIVTDGNLWQFGKLVERTFIKNTVNYTIDDLPELFGAVDLILRAAAQDGL